ncbi:hypothetical protein Tco_0864858 [Tanacetum coccineum]
MNEILKLHPPKLMVDCLDDLDYFKDFKNEFPAIVYNDGLTSKSDLEIEPPVCSLHINKFETSLSKYDEEERNALHVTFPDNLKTIKDSDDNIDITQPSGYMAPLPAADQRHPWLRYQVEGYTEGIVHSYKQRLEMIWSRLVNRVYVLDFEDLTPGMRQDLAVRMSDTEMGLDVDGSDRLIPDKGDLRDYWIEISSDRDLFGLAPSYVLIRDPVRRLMDRGTTNVPHLLAQYLFRHDEGRKSYARLSEGYFIRCLAMLFGLISDEGLRGLQVVTRELPLIDLHELGRLNICSRYGDTWAWVAQGPERQQVAAIGSHEADEAGLTADEGA